jgi:hypothetical protein
VALGSPRFQPGRSVVDSLFFNRLESDGAVKTCEVDGTTFGASGSRADLEFAPMFS